jgi:predicted nucleotidyltransferase component of viral defense system
LNDDLPTNLRPVADFFGLVGTPPVVKDFHVVRAIRTLAALDAAPFRLVFAGGTALARAHKLIRRMSEDVDFKIVPLAPAPVSRNARQRGLSDLRERVTTALHAAGFAFDPADPVRIWRSQNENRYTIWQLPYAYGEEIGEGLRPTIQVELTYAELRLPAVTRPVSSFVAEAFGRAPEVDSIPCVSLTETAAEKLVSLTRRIAAERAGVSRDPDPTLVRHIYDLHALREHVDPVMMSRLAREIALADAKEFANQHPAYATDIAGETRKTLHAIQTDPAYRKQYDDFVAAMVYGEKWGFEGAITTVASLSADFLKH